MIGPPDDVRPGRRCPPGYGYAPRVFARAAELHADILYVAGGLYGNLPALLYIDALAVHYDVAAWHAQCTRLWPDGSAADLSYRRRVIDGPQFTVDDALGRSVRAACLASG